MKIFSRNKESSDPAIIIDNCFIFLFNKLCDDLNSDAYHWNKPWGVKRYESMLLSKFIIDYSFNKLVEDQLNDDEKIAFFSLSDSVFMKTFNSEFSEVGLNYEDMQEEINSKVEKYFEARREFRKPPQCWFQIFMILTGSKSREELEEMVKNKLAGLELMKGNENFSSMIPNYQAQIKLLQNKANAFDLAEMMMSHMIRSARQRLKVMKLKKIKALSKKIAKKDKKK